MKDSIKCLVCGIECERRGPMQKYCEECSVQKSRERGAKWARKNPLSAGQKNRRRILEKSRESAMLNAGAKASKENSTPIAWINGSIDPLWITRVAVPFSYAASKNALYTNSRNGGHRFMRKKSRALLESISSAISSAVDMSKVVHNKVWVDIFVQKPDHRGDAINVVDLVCDGIKDAIPVDDRWFCIRRLDWEVCKIEPKIYIGIGQDSDVDVSLCSHCGAIKPLREFGKRKDTPLGVSRACKSCTRIAAAERRTRK